MNEMPECSNSVVRKARKNHTCSTCGANIKSGEEYLYVSGIWSGEPNSYKACANCESVFDNFKEMDNDLSFEDGPSISMGGVSVFLQGFLSIHYSGIQAAKDMAERLKVPLWYIKKMIGLKDD